MNLKAAVEISCGVAGMLGTLWLGAYVISPLELSDWRFIPLTGTFAMAGLGFSILRATGMSDLA